MPSRMEHPHHRTAHEKAYDLNHGMRFYGAFAEIGAGQEVARTFFQAGKAAALIAKSMSAYSMRVSDSIYMSHNGRDFEYADHIAYTSRYRLIAMLHHEYHLMMERFIVAPDPRLAEKRGGVFPCLFAYANTFSTGDVHYGSHNTFNGWMGVRIQSRIGGFQGEREEIDYFVDLLAHVVLLEHDRKGQYETIGYMGVNLIDAAARLLSDLRIHPDQQRLVNSLFDGVSKWKVRMDVLEINPSSALKERHPNFTPNNRELSLLVVQESLSHDTLLSPHHTTPPGELCAARSGKTYQKWGPELETWHVGRGMDTDQSTACWTYPGNDIREPVRFFVGRHVCLINGDIIKDDSGKYNICVCNSILRFMSSLSEDSDFPVVVLPVEELPKVPNQEQVDFIAFDGAYKRWIGANPRSAVLITRSSDMAWVVESVRKSLGEDRLESPRPPFAMMLHQEQWQKLLHFDFEGARKTLADKIKNHKTNEHAVLWKRDWEQLSTNQLDCLQRIERAGCTIKVVVVDTGITTGGSANLPPRGEESELRDERNLPCTLREEKASDRSKQYVNHLLSTNSLVFI